MSIVFFHRNKFGTFWIAQRGERWEAGLGDEGLGSYHRPEAALDDLVGGHTFAPSSGLDTAAVGLPEDLREWERGWSR